MTISGPTATLRLTGPDSERFLSGQITQSLADFQPGETRYTFICDAKGRIQFHCELQRDGEGYSIVTEFPQAESLLARLDRYLIADDCKLLLEPQGPSAPEDQKAELNRLEQGTPAHQDLEGALPAETGLLETAVSFAKGCYQGQEVISRMKRAGKTNRLLEQFQLLESSPNLPAEFFQQGTEKPLLIITSVSELPDSSGKHPALGYLSSRADKDKPLTSQSGNQAYLI